MGCRVGAESKPPRNCYVSTLLRSTRELGKWLVGYTAPLSTLDYGPPSSGKTQSSTRA